ncbi:MAG: PLP-dependent aminotransferase family protein [Sulfolobales archaeon]|nr:PLP-dependent aminotransferase family protein [Sulfolobales archaeon]MCG2894515.1 PLP-dependent aminotransferase family protein [Sulfolobales archaeon]MCG2910201.1 PLP-dependent aminotransferase family protein [Sulfolobales archaeon]MCQ4343542.1 PLP-dependent aminotransferase family protein [Sulfolobales archaeon]
MFEKFLSHDVQYLRSSEIRDLLKLTEGKNVISLAGGLPDPSTFPIEDIKRIAEDVISSKPEISLQYTPTPGITEFREQLVKLASLRGITGIDPTNTFATVGSQEALYMTFNLLVDPGDYVAVEKPTYLTALNVLRARRPNYVGVPLTPEGPDLDSFETSLRRLKAEGKRLKLFYVIPTAQNPGGTTMSLNDRKRLIELAEEYDFLIVEDDAYGFLVFEGDSPPPLKALDRSERVIYLGTFSKILSPGLRLGYVIASKEFINELELLKQNLDLHTPSLTQMIAAEAIKRGVIERQIPIIRKTYKEKRDVMLQAIEESFPKDAKWSRPVGGMFIFVWLSEKFDTVKLLEEAMRRGVAYVPGSSFFYDYSGRNTMRLNFSFPSKDELRRGVEILGKLLKEVSA